MTRGTVTMGDVARLAGVSKMTVSNVINNRPGVSDAVRDRVLGIIRESGYRVNVSARTLKSGRTNIIGLAVPDVSAPYFGHLAMHVIEAAAEQGFRIAIEQTGAVAAGEIDVITQSNLLQFDGLILSAVGIDPRDHRLPGGEFPIVMLGERDFGAAFDHVAMANEDGSAAATRHLLDRGCRRIAAFTGTDPGAVNAATRRYEGYSAAHRGRGLEPDPRLRVRLNGWRLESGREAAHRLVDSGVDFDGAVAVTDTVAHGLLRGFADRGVRVPEDVRVVGFDDIPESAFTVPSLSTVAPEHGWMARQAVELVAHRIKDPDRPPVELTAPFELVERESST